MMPEETEESWERRSVEQNWRILNKMTAISEKHQLSHAQIALAWLLKQPGVCSIIIGARTIEQLDDNLKAAEVTLPDAELEDLTKLSAPKKGYPYRFIDLYGQR